jgi:hypothetical protein
MDGPHNASHPDMEIRMSGKAGLSPKVIGTRGIRDTALMIAAAVQGFYLIFMVDTMPFVVRLVLAAGIGGVLVVLALIKPQNLTFEQHLSQMLGYRTRPRRRVHQTADRDARPLQNLGQGGSTATKPAKETQARPAFRVRFGMPSLALGLDNLDPGLLMTLFLGLMLMGSVLAYVGQGGRF